MVEPPVMQASLGGISDRQDFRWLKDLDWLRPAFGSFGRLADRVLSQSLGIAASCVLEDAVQHLAMLVYRARTHIIVIESREEAPHVGRLDLCQSAASSKVASRLSGTRRNPSRDPRLLASFPRARGAHPSSRPNSAGRSPRFGLAPRLQHRRIRPVAAVFWLPRDGAGSALTTRPESRRALAVRPGSLRRISARLQNRRFQVRLLAAPMRLSDRDL